MSALKVGDRVRLAEHLVPHFDGATHGVVVEVNAIAEVQNTVVNVGGRDYYFAAADLTLDPLESDMLDLQAIGAATIAEYAPESRASRMFPIGTRVEPVPNFGEIGTIIPLAELDGPVDDTWNDENTFVIRWDGKVGHTSIHGPESIREAVRVALESIRVVDEDDGTEAEVIAVVEVPKPITDLRPRFSRAGHASAFGGAA